MKAQVAIIGAGPAGLLLSQLLDLAGIAVLTVVAGAAQVLVGSRLGLYVHRWRYGTIDEVAALGATG